MRILLMCLVTIAVAAEEVKNSEEFDRKPQKRGSFGTVYGGGSHSADSELGKFNLGSIAGRTEHGKILNVPAFGQRGIELSPADIGLSSAGYGHGGIILITAGNSVHGGLGLGFASPLGGQGIGEVLHVLSPAASSGGHGELVYGLGSGSYGYGRFGGDARGQVQVHQAVPITVNRPVPGPYSVPVPRPVPVHIPVTVVRPYPVTVTQPYTVPVPLAQPYTVPVPQVFQHVPQTINVEVPAPIFLSSGNTGGFKIGGSFPGGTGQSVNGVGHSSGSGINHIGSTVPTAVRHSSGISLGPAGTFTTEHVLGNGGSDMGEGTNFGSGSSILGHSSAGIGNSIGHGSGFGTGSSVIGHSSATAGSSIQNGSGFRSGNLVVGQSSGGGQNVGHESSYISSSGNSELRHASRFASGSDSISLGHEPGYTATSTSNLITGHGGSSSGGSAGIGQISVSLQNSGHSNTVESNSAYKN